MGNTTERLPDGKYATRVVITSDPDNSPFNIVGTHQSDATISTATVLTPPQGASKVIVQAQEQNVRYTLDGTTPTSAVGFLLYAGDTVTISIGTGTIIKMIEAASGAAIAYQWGV
jgi:hypothetical protein